MNLCPDIQPERDQDPSPVPEIEEQLEEHQPLPGRQKASAQLEPIHPPTVIAKLCSTAFKSNVGNMAIPFTILVVVFVMIMMMRSSCTKLELLAGQISTTDNPA